MGHHPFHQGTLSEQSGLLSSPQNEVPCGSGFSISKPVQFILIPVRGSGRLGLDRFAGGVPDADDTAGALTALYELGEPDAATIRAAEAGIEWLLNLANRDGGIPTFCPGWGTLPFDRSTPEITAHALRAWNCWRSSVNAKLQGRVARATAKAFQYLQQNQNATDRSFHFGLAMNPRRKKRIRFTVRRKC